MGYALCRVMAFGRFHGARGPVVHATSPDCMEIESTAAPAATQRNHGRTQHAHAGAYGCRSCPPHGPEVRQIPVSTQTLDDEPSTVRVRIGDVLQA